MSDPAVAIVARPTDKPPRHRRLIPLSLRIFIGILVAIGIGNSLWIGVAIYRQQVAIQTVNDLGGTVSTVPGGPNWLRQLMGGETMRSFDSVQIVDFHTSDITDADLEHLAPLQDVEFLDLSATRVSDRGIRHLKDLKKLGALRLWHTDVTRAGVDDLWSALPDVAVGIRFDDRGS